MAGKPNQLAMRNMPKAKNPLKSFLRLMGFVFEGKWAYVIVILLCIIVSSLATTYSASFIGTFIDEIVIPLKGVENPSFSAAFRSLGKFAIVICVAILSSYLSSWIMVGISQGAIYKMRTQMFDKLESLPLSYFDQNARGTIMSTFSNDTDTINQLVSNGLVQLLTAGITLIMVLFSMFSNSVILTLVVFVFIVITFIATSKVGSKSGRYYASQQKDLADVNGFIEEMINGQRVIKVFTHEDESRKDFASINEKLNHSMADASSWAGSMGPLNNNLGHLQYVVLVLFGAVAIINNPTIYTIGGLAAFLQLSKSFTNNVSQISQQSNNVLVALAGAERVFALLDQKSEIDNGKVTLVRVNDHGENMHESQNSTGKWAWRKDGKLIPFKGSVVIEGVDFAYVPGKTVLHDISLYAKPGQKIAFVGATGAGKTTITNLLNRFYNIEKGEITIDGINIMDMSLSSLRRSMAMVLQDTSLFTGTIKDNIRYGRLDASDEDIVKAAKLANAHDFIMMMPNGYDTVITNNGENLSQGQRQLLSIARCAVGNPPILIMDEATSSIDTHTEALVQSGMDKLMENRTVFVIAHRLSTVRNSNAIMVLENGRIIERGDHDDLIRAKGVYYSLYTGSTELS